MDFKEGFLDDIDLVLRALKHEEGSATKRAIERDKRFTESLTKKG